tara:strand:- start:7250 stop:8290 length:1041 start_codon:yes stop_codon:yes gene_type:complete
MAREILEEEIGLKLNRSRFEWRGRLYPLHIVVFEDDHKLGSYDSSQWRIGLSLKLLKHAKDAVTRDVLRHEIAHMMTHLEFGENLKPHGQEFKSVCDKLGFDHKISNASLELETANDSYEGDLAGEKVLNRIKKLMALSESPNAHEAELATKKANELLIRHNLERLELDPFDSEVYVLPVMFAAKSNTKMHAVYEILKTFFVAPVFTKRNGKVALDVVGDRTSVKVAEYVASFLEGELERLWLQAKKTQKLSGLRAKNSFFAGVAKGYVTKLEESHKEYSRPALIKINQHSKELLARVYGRLSSTSSGSKADHNALNIGNSAGKKLSIRAGVESTSSKRYLLNHDS